jgi:hypothetical protein
VGANQGADLCNGVAVDGSGNVYCAGYTTGDFREPNAGAGDALVLKLNAAGTVQWAAQLGTLTKPAGAPGIANQGDDRCMGVAVDASGNVYCSGWTDTGVSEANGGFGFEDSMVMKFNSSGTLQWVTQFGAVTKAPGAPALANRDDDQCNGVAVDGSGNVYCAGTVAGILGEVAGGSYDAFVLKLTTSGGF